MKVRWWLTITVFFTVRSSLKLGNLAYLIWWVFICVLEDFLVRNVDLLIPLVVYQEIEASYTVVWSRIFYRVGFVFSRRTVNMC